MQTSHQNLITQVADYPLLPMARRARGLRSAFEKQAKFLREFLAEKASGSVPAADFMELLSACLQALGPEAASSMDDLRAALLELGGRHAPEEIATALKPRSLIAPHLAGYQEVARALVNRVRFQSQRLDMANPYAMRGTLTRTGRAVLVEQVPPERLATGAVLGALEARSGAPAAACSMLLPVPLVHRAEGGLACMAEEVVEGITLADLLLSRKALNVHETYLVLAGLDAALSQLEGSGLGTARLRLEDIHLLTGFPREDARSLKLLMTQLTDWPAFSIMLRAHPTLAAMTRRGTDPGVLLPPSAVGTWDAGWLSALGRFLLALEPLPQTAQASPQRGPEVDTVVRLLDEEITKCRDGVSTRRGDFLARFARIVHHHDLARPPGGSQDGGGAKISPKKPKTAGLQQIQATPMPTAAATANPAPSPSGPLPAGNSPVIAPISEKPSVGFAELLFRGTSETAPASGPDWARTAVDAPPTIHPAETLLPEELVPLWLRLAVFLGGSMVAGAIFAHFSGHALWQRPHAPPAARAPAQTSQSAPAVPKALPVTQAVPAPEPPPIAAPVPEVPVSTSSLLKPPPSQREAIGDTVPTLPPSTN
ncbi:MAG: hypothetical protein LDL31_08120 [Prosthecobacter sp.]|nr:hypothetical protein [Prosthecobacter sp.]